MKAVIPAAGLGTRFLPYTKTQPKEMLPVVDKPAIQYVVEEAIASGLRDILMVTGRGKSSIQEYFDRNVALEDYLSKTSKTKALAKVREISGMATITYVRQKEPLGLGHAVLSVEKHISKEPFAVLLGDDILVDEIPCTKRLVNLFKRKKTPVLAVQEMPLNKVSAYGVVTGKALGDGVYRVEDIVEKPAPDKVRSNLVSIGRYVFSSGIFEQLRSVKPGVGGEIQLTDAIRSLLEDEEVYALKFGGKRYDVGSKASWLRANIELAMYTPELGQEIIELLKDYPTK